MSVRIGYGEDIHLLVEGRDLILAGVKLPFEKGLLGHSDADVVYHAIADCLLGSVAEGDIGVHFRTDDPKCEGMDSSIIAKFAINKVKEHGYRLSNIDVSIICEKPHLMKHIPAMRENVAKTLECGVEDVSVKAMTNEGLGEIGEGKAIKAIAVAVVTKE